jgi:hypothetical protein
MKNNAKNQKKVFDERGKPGLHMRNVKTTYPHAAFAWLNRPDALKKCAP